MLIQHSGASQVVAGSLVAYTLETKTRLLEIPEDVLQDGVNPDVAFWMAQKARVLFDSNWGLGITGFAGPLGGNPKEPVGAAYLAISGPISLVQRQVFNGERHEIQFQVALEILRLWEFCLDRISFLGLS
jgi:PncC family amidohydrolase